MLFYIVVIEFKDSAYIYSVVEGIRVYSVTIVKQGEPTQDLVISIFPSPDSTAADTVKCKSINSSVYVCDYISCT